MTPGEIIEKLKRKGHSFKVLGGFLKISSAVQKVNAEEISLLKNHKDELLNYLLGDAMKLSIHAIAAEYEPEIENLFSKFQWEQKQSLDRMRMETVEEIELWRRGWLNLIKEAKMIKGDINAK